MADNRMTFTLVGRDNLSSALNRAGVNARRLRTDLLSVGSLAALPKAAVGAAAALQLAAAVGTAGVALVAFGAAAGPQVASIGKVAEAQKTYTDTVKKSGAASEAAAKAQLEYHKATTDLPKATRESAAAFIVLRDSYQDWSDELADDTMPVFTRSFQTLTELLPKLSPLVRTASGSLQRFIAIAAGGISTPGFDRMMSKFDRFTSETLHRAEFAVADLIRTLRTPAVGGGIESFMDFAEKHGPLVRETLTNVGAALTKLIVASADAGVGMLTLVNALAKLVNAIPSGALSNLIQLYVTIRLLRTAMAGLAAVATAGAVARLGAFFQLMRVAGVGATMGALAASMTRVQRAAVGLGILAVVAIGIKKLADRAKGAPPDVDRLTTALMRLSSTGKFTGELKDTFGNVDGLVKKIKQLRQETADMERSPHGFRIPGLDDAADGITRLIKSIKNGDTSVGALEEDFKALDQSLTGLVKSGHADVAAQSFQKIRAAAKAQGISMKELNSLVPNYRDAIASLKANNELAARGMGIFGKQALKTKEQLDAQKLSADGLRQAILDLNNVNRDAYDAQIAFEAGIDSLTAAFKENGATLNLNTKAGQQNASAMSSAAKAHDEMLAAGIAAGDSLASMTGKSSTLRAEMLRLAKSTGMSDQAAKKYVSTLLGTPGSIKTLVKLERKDALTGLQAVQAQIKRTPGKKKITVNTLNAAAIAALEKVGLKTRRLPDGRTQVYTRNGQALGSIGAVNRAMNNLDGKTARTFVNTYYTSIYRSVRKGQSFSPAGPGVRRAQGGPVPGYAHGGYVQSLVEGGFIRGPGTSTSDSIVGMFSRGSARVSDREYVIKAAAVRKYGVKMFDALNQMRAKKFDMAGARITPTRNAATRTASPAPTTNNTTYNVYPQRADFTIHDLEALQRRQDTRARVGRPR